MAEITSPRAADLVSVRSRVSWGAIAAGAMVALSIYIILSMLGVALGVEVAVRGTNTHFGSGAARRGLSPGRMARWRLESVHREPLIYWQ